MRIQTGGCRPREVRSERLRPVRQDLVISRFGTSRDIRSAEGDSRAEILPSALATTPVRRLIYHWVPAGSTADRGPISPDAALDTGGAIEPPKQGAFQI